MRQIRMTSEVDLIRSKLAEDFKSQDIENGSFNIAFEIDGNVSFNLFTVLYRLVLKFNLYKFNIYEFGCRAAI